MPAGTTLTSVGFTDDTIIRITEIERGPNGRRFVGGHFSPTGRWT